MSAMTMFIVLTPLTASAAVPGQTTGLTAASGDKQVVLAWTAVNSTPAVTDYFIEYSSDAGVTYTRFFDAVSNSTTATVTGLTNDKIYYFASQIEKDFVQTTKEKYNLVLLND